jgi:ATP-dependent Clp protease ATP-binding subunit ClpC
MTSNIGVRKFQDFGGGMGFKKSDYVEEEHKRDILKSELSKFFAPEFLNRIDDVIIFNSLKKDHIDKIVKLEIDILLNRLTKMKYNFIADYSVIEMISKVGFDEMFGARPLKRAIQDKIEDLISEGILIGDVKENTEYTLMVENDSVKIVGPSTPKEKPKRTKKKKEVE